MDNRSKKLVELLDRIKAAFGQGDVCGPYTVASGAEPDIELTLNAKGTGQVIKFHLWRVEIEQWRDFDPLTNTPVAGPGHIKLIGDIAKSEQVSPPRKQEEPKKD